MKRSSVIVRVLALSMVFVLSLGLAACGGKKKDKEETTTAESTSETTPMVTVATTVATTTLQEYGLTLAPNDQQVTWTETEMDAKVMYVKITSGYLKVRKGPGVDYEQVGSLSAGMEVIAVAKTENNWYKLQDGYYVSGDYISATP
ncbi:MAG: SH3 domain-containing protein [Clostridiales bacterium]|nr:SH3 domain-containing protein [Clostridiales bacterium]